MDKTIQEETVENQKSAKGPYYSTLVAFGLGSLVVCSRIAMYIVTPLWLDSTKPCNGSTENGTANPAHDDTLQIDPYYYVNLTQGISTTVLFGIIVLILKICRPGTISERETSFPKVQFVIPGIAQAISSLLFNYSSSGSRTPPYLQATLSNFNIPITFVVRFIILRKRPTVRKFICAFVIFCSEVVCLLPSIFPQLEDAKAHKREGGAKGIAGILLPICHLSSMIPFAINNAFNERIVQKKNSQDKKTKDKPSIIKEGHLNLFYFLFWYSFSLLLTILLLFWTDIIPGFGNSSSITHFGKMLWFNAKCSLGVASCGANQAILYSVNIWSNIVGLLTINLFLRHTEGANLMVILLTVRTPLLFLFWTLFNECPFGWSPHAHLSTWLSIGAIVVMLPTVYIYNTGAPEKSSEKTSSTTSNLIHRENTFKDYGSSKGYSSN